MKPETQFRNSKVNPFLKTLKTTYHLTVQQIAKRGDSDKILCIRGYFIALELKAKDGVLSELQKIKLDDVRKSHGVAIIASPNNWGEVKDYLLKFSKGEITHDTIRNKSWVF